jgi:hypothetical protein
LELSVNCVLHPLKLRNKEMSRFRLTGICLALSYGGIALSIGGGFLVNTAMAKGHGGHKGGGHHASHHHSAHHHAASHHHSHHHAKLHAHAHATGHAAHRAYAHAGHHFAHHYNHHHHYWHNGHRYWAGGGYYGGTYVNGGTVVNGATVTGDGGIVVPPTLGPGATLAYPTVLGNIGSIAGNALTIVRPNGRVMRVVATPSTIITLNDNSAAIGDLRVSDRVKASYDPESNAITLVALRD